MSKRNREKSKGFKEKVTENIIRYFVEIYVEQLSDES